MIEEMLSGDTHRRIGNQEWEGEKVLQENRFKQCLSLAQPYRFFWCEIIPQGCHTPEFVPPQIKGAGLSSSCTSHWLTSQGHKLPGTPSSLPVLDEVTQTAQWWFSGES